MDIMRMEGDLSHLTVVKSNLPGYTMCFEDVTVICPSLIGTESKKIEAYAKGLGPKIQEMIIAAKLDSYNSVSQLAFRLT